MPLNRHQFEQAAKQFRAGRITLSDFSDLVFPESEVQNVTSQDSSGLIRIPTRASDGHKGDFGKVLAVGGSPGMPGAIALSAISALRCGAGLVLVSTLTEVVGTVAGFSPCYMTAGGLESGYDAIEDRVEWADVIMLGPGLGRESAQVKVASRLYRDAKQPMVVDADGLNCLADAGIELADHAGPRIMTPHPGEFRTLTGVAIDNRAKMEAAAIQFAAEEELIVVLKGHETLISDGEMVIRNETGNSGMATAGSGDVLTGTIAAFLGQGLAPLAAAVTGCHVHGLAGDLCAKEKGEYGLISSDLTDFLPQAICQIA